MTRLTKPWVGVAVAVDLDQRVGAALDEPHMTRSEGIGGLVPIGEGAIAKGEQIEPIAGIAGFEVGYRDVARPQAGDVQPIPQPKRNSTLAPV